MPKRKNYSGMVWGLNEHLWDVLDKDVRYMDAPSRKLQELKGFAVNFLVPDTTVHLP